MTLQQRTGFFYFPLLLERMYRLSQMHFIARLIFNHHIAQYKIAQCVIIIDIRQHWTNFTRSILQHFKFVLLHILVFTVKLDKLLISRVVL